MKTTTLPILVLHTTALALALLGAAGNTGFAAETYSFLDYFNPVYAGNEWVYEAHGISFSKMVARIDAPSTAVTCYKGKGRAQPFTIDAVRVYNAYGDFDTQGQFIPGDTWYEYNVARTSWGMLGSDEEPGPQTMRVFPGFMLPNPMAIGQAVTFKDELYLNGSYRGTMTVKFQLLEHVGVTVPAGTYPDCIHFKYTVTQSGETQINEEWWARDFGKVKKTRNVTKSGRAPRLEEYDLVGATVIRGAWVAVPPADVSVVAGSAAHFEVQALGEPPLSYQWRKDGVDLSDGANISGSTSAGLTLSNVQDSDRGSYSVVVNNVHGAVASSGATLSLLPPETIKPTVTISFPTKNTRSKLMLVTATGKATDNVRVAAVWYQLNGNDWALAAGTTDWSAADLELTPGINVLRAYAVDSSGNASVTRTVSFNYVVTAPVELTVNGRGSVSPNYDGQSLEVGKTYRVTARAASGFGFDGWTGSLTGDSPTLAFTMAPNLVLTANFVDVTRPVNAVLSPKARDVLASATAPLAGKSLDNVGVAAVFYQLNGGGWQTATTLNAWTNWSATDVPLQGGNNALQTYAIDAAGNCSLTNTISFVCTVTQPNIAGLWNATSLQTPAQVTWDPVNGLQTGNGFETATGYMNVEMNGALSGEMRGAFTGTWAFGTNGQVLAQLSHEGRIDPGTLNLNASQDTLTFTRSSLGQGENSQEVIIFQRVPASLANADLAGIWNIAQFDTPAQLSWDPSSGLAGGRDFDTRTGTLNVKRDGTLVANAGHGVVKGVYTVGDGGQVVVSINGDPQPKILFVNAGKNLMVLGNEATSLTDNYRGLMLFTRRPSSASRAELAGFWNATWFSTPGRMNWTPSSGSYLSDNFGSDYGFLSLKADGTLTGDVRGAFAGTFALAPGGKVTVEVNGSHGPDKVTLFLDANKDILVLVSSNVDPHDNIQQLIIFQRAPVFSAP